MSEPNWQNRIHNEDRKSSHQLDREAGNRKTVHGEPGHTGWKCPECAMEATVVVVAFPEHDEDGWQNTLLDWQEKCDELHSAKINHLPDHTPNNASTDCFVGTEKCILYKQDPTKPVKAFERLSSRVWAGDP